MAFDAGAIEVRLTLDRSQFTDELRAARADGDKGVTVKAAFDNKAANAAIADTQNRSDKLAKSAPAVRVAADNAKANAGLDDTLARARKLGAASPTIKVKADTASANARLKETANYGNKVAAGFEKIPTSIALISAALPAAISLTGVLAGASIAVEGGFASAGLAAVAFGAVAKPMFTATEAAIKKVTAAQAALAKASTPAARIAALKAEKTAMDSLTPSEVKLYKAVSDLQGEWKKLNTSLQPDVWRAIQPYLDSAGSSMGLLATVVRPASDAIRDIGQNVQLLMSSPTTQQFAQFIGATGSQSLEAGGSFLVNVLKTVMELMPQFRPLISSADTAIVKIGDDMAAWAGSAGAKNGIQSFMQWVHDNAGVVTTLLKNVGSALANVGSGLASGGGIGELKLVSDFFGLVAKLPKSWISPVVELASTLALISKFGFGRKLISIGVNWAGQGAAQLLKLLTGGSIDLTSKFGSTGMQKAADTMVTAAAAMQKAADTMAGADAEGGAAGKAGGAAAGAEGIAGDAGKAGLAAAVVSTLSVAAVVAGVTLLANAVRVRSQQKGGVLGGTDLNKDSAFTGRFGPASPGGSPLPQQPKPKAVASQGGTNARKLGLGKGKPLPPALPAPGSGARTPGAGTSAQKLDLRGSSKPLPRALPAPGNTGLPVLDAAQTANLQAVAKLLGVTLPAAYKLSAAAGVNLSKSLGAQGAAATDARSRLSAEAAILGEMPGRSAEATKAMTGYTSSLRLNGSASSTTIAARHQLITDLVNSGVSSRTATALVAKLSAGIGDNANNIAVTHPTRKSLIDDLTASGLKASTARGDVDNYTTAVRQNGTNSADARGARAQLIKDLENAGIQAGTARKIVRNLTTSLTNIPKSEHTNISVTGTGNYTVQQLGLGGGSKPLPAPLPSPNKAAGGLITGGIPGKDSVLINAMPGEVVVPTRMVNAGAVDHLRGRIPGFSSGGVVGAYSGSAKGLGPWAAAEVDKTLTALERAVAGVTAAAIKANYIAGATTSAIGDLPANWRAIASFLSGHGYSHAAASGIAGNILQESGGNPESVGSGGGGLIGWTPLPAGYVTGNAGHDLATQLNQILAYNNRNGGASVLNSQPTAAAAALYYMSHFERPAPATENAQRREEGANAVFKAMGYAGGTGGAKQGWAQVGERGRELVYFHGGETVLPNSLTNHVLSGSVSMPGYASGTAPHGRASNGGSTVTAPHIIEGGGSQDYDARLKRYTAQLAAMQAKVTAHIKALRVPIEKDELYLLEHPNLSKSAKAAREKELEAREKAVTTYRTKSTADESTLVKEIALLKKLIAAEPNKKVPPGKLPPGINKGSTKAQDLAELAKLVTDLGSLKKKATAHIATLRKPIDEEELYLLQHPNIKASTKSAIEAEIKKREAAVTKYRKTTAAQETKYQDEISLLRTLTGNPAAAKYGGAGAASTTGTGDSGTADSGSGTSAAPSGPPPGQFVGTLPAPPSSGGALPSGGGTGGLGAGGAAGTPGGLSFTSGGVTSPLGLGPSASAGWSVPGALPGGSFSLGAAAAGTATPGTLAGAFPGMPAGPAAMSGANVEKLLGQLLQATRAAPAQTGGHLAGALNGTSRAALGSARWNAG